MRNLLAFMAMLPCLAVAQLPDYVPLDGLVGWYPFNGNTENLAGEDDTLATTSIDWTMDRYGMDSSAITFPALNSHAFGSLPADFQNNHYSYALWWRIDGAFNYNGYNLLTYPNASPGNLASNALSYTIGENWYYLNCPDASSGYTSSARIGDDHTLRALDCAVLEDMEQWNHSVVTVDSTMMRLYFNGALIEAVSVDLNMSDFLGETLVLGARNNPTQNSLTTRILDEVGIWNRALNEAEVQALFLGAPIEYGCTDPGACNFQDEASADDGSCEYGCLFCGEGTVWDSTLQQCVSIAPPCAPSCGQGTVWDPINEECIIAIPADLNYDGCVTVNDLLELLAVHGTCPPYPEWPDEPTDTTWTCGDPITYWDYDYATVLIGDQCWFADNLRSTQYQTGDSIVLWDYEGEVDTYGLGHYTYKDLNTANADTFGLLYTWHAATHELQLCPTGWHTPSQQEFQNLMNATDVISGDLSSTAQVTALQSSSIWTLGTGSNATGFSALPGSQRTPWGGLGYGDQYEEAFWWTSDQDGFDFVNLSLAEPLNGEEKQIKFDTCDNPNDAMSIRCIQD